jgi:hypothetical protein
MHNPVVFGLTIRRVDAWPQREQIGRMLSRCAASASGGFPV